MNRQEESKIETKIKLSRAENSKELFSKLEISILMTLLFILITLSPFIFSSLLVSIIKNEGTIVFDKSIAIFSIIIGVLTLISSLIAKFNPLKFNIFNNKRHIQTITLILFIITFVIFMIISYVLFKVLGYV